MKRKYYISPLEKGYSSTDERNGRKLVIVLAMLFILISYPAYSFFGGGGGLSLGPLLVVAKDILAVTKQIDEGLSTLEKLENKTIGRLEKLRNDFYRYTHIHDDLNNKIANTIYRIERLYQRAQVVFDKEFYRDYGYRGGLDRLVRYIDSVKIDKNGNIVRSDGRKAPDSTIKAYVDTLSGGVEPPFYDPKVRAVIDTNPKVRAGYTQVKIRKTEVKKAVANTLSAESVLAGLDKENQRIYTEIVKGVDSGVLEQRKALLLAMNNRYLSLLNKQLAYLIKLNAMKIGKEIHKEEEALYKMIKSKTFLK
ncbi:hypothetical protein [Persephonella sp.]